MEAKELMQFDWVCSEGDPTPRQVDWIRSGEVGLYWNKIVTPPYIKPIPLTPKILEKNEFTLKEEEKGMYGVTIAPYYTRDDVPFEVFCDGEPFAVWFKDPVNIKYVHELQHALRLCGITREIIL